MSDSPFLSELGELVVSELQAEYLIDFGIEVSKREFLNGLISKLMNEKDLARRCRLDTKRRLLREKIEKANAQEPEMRVDFDQARFSRFADATVSTMNLTHEDCNTSPEYLSESPQPAFAVATQIIADTPSLEEVDYLRNEVSKLFSELSSHQNVINSQKECIKILESEASRLKTSLQNSSMCVSAFEIEITGLKNSLAFSESSKSGSEEALATAREMLRDKQDEIEKLSSNFALALSLQGKTLDSKSVDTVAKNTEISHLQAIQSKLLGELDRLQSTLADSEQKYKDLETINIEHEKIIAGLKSKMKKGTEDFASLSDKEVQTEEPISEPINHPLVLDCSFKSPEESLSSPVEATTVMHVPKTSISKSRYQPFSNSLNTAQELRGARSADKKTSKSNLVENCIMPAGLSLIQEEIHWEVNFSEDIKMYDSDTFLFATLKWRLLLCQNDDNSYGFFLCLLNSKTSRESTRACFPAEIYCQFKSHRFLQDSFMREKVCNYAEQEKNPSTVKGFKHFIGSDLISYCLNGVITLSIYMGTYLDSSSGRLISPVERTA